MATGEYGPVEDPYLISRPKYTIRGQQKHGYVQVEYEKFSTCRASTHLFMYYRIYDPDGCLVYYKQSKDEKGFYYDGGECPDDLSKLFEEDL